MNLIENGFNNKKQIRDWIITENVEIKRLTKIQFSRRMEGITNCPKAQCGKLYKELKTNQEEKEKYTEEDQEALINGIITNTSNFRNERRLKIRNECIESNINENSW